ncbi:caspase family protein [Streptomyces sp. 7N604]|uniref:caspase family protein n=1 Tax=Streptomyces sp. 7N604 TaxID=3457415 RepID=UPI003FD5DB15
MTRLIRRRALLIGNDRYDDGRFSALPSTQADIWELRQVLEHRNIGAFASVMPLTDLTADDMRQAISEFLESCDQDELALVYVSGHGTRLVQSGGEFSFIATDTDFDRIAETGVSAGFVNEQLEQCWAPQKVMMIDCCRSGGFAVGLRTSDRQAASVAKSGEESLLTSRGVYVLSSSRAGEDSYADTVSTAEVKPSAFTTEVIEALRTGKVGKDGSGEVSVDDLFHYVNRRMRAQGGRQVPVKSAHGVDDRIVLASCPLGSAPLLVPLSRRPAAQPEGPARPQPKAALPQPTWNDLLTTTGSAFCRTTPRRH